MFNFKGQSGYLRIEHLVGGIGRLVFVPGTVDESTEAKPVPLTRQDFKELGEQWPHYQIHMNIYIDKRFVGQTHATRAVVSYPICQHRGDEDGGVLSLSGGKDPLFAPSTPFLEYTGETGEILVDITPIRLYAAQHFFGL